MQTHLIVGALALVLVAGGSPLAAAAAGCGAGAAPPSLGFEEALQRWNCHPDWRRAQAAVERVRADGLIAGQRPNASLTLGAVSLPKGGVGPGPWLDKPFDHQARWDQPIERGDKRRLRQAAAQAETDAAERERDQARRDARAGIAVGYWDTWLAQARWDAQRQIVEATVESLRLIEQRVQAGDAAAIERDRWRVELARVRADAATAQVEWAASVARWRLLVGWVEGSPVLQSPAKAFPALETPPRAVPFAAETLSRDPRGAAVAARTEAGRRRVTLAQAQQTRDLSIGVQADRYPATAAFPAGNGNTVSLSITVPLFTGHAFEGERARALADLQALEEEQALMGSALQAEWLERQAQAQAAWQRWRLAEEELLPAAQRLAAAAEAAYRRGGASLLELLEARRALRLAQMDHLGTLADWAKAHWLWRALLDMAPDPRS